LRLLMIYCESFGYRTSMRTLDTVPEIDEKKVVENVLVAFIHIEEKDAENLSYVETKLVKNIKWAARKNETESVLLHSFTHLSESKADPEKTNQIFLGAKERLETAGYTTQMTPFGYFLDLEIRSAGNPLTRLYKEIQSGDNSENP